MGEANTTHQNDPGGLPLVRRPRAWGRRLQLIRHLVQWGFLGFIVYLMAVHTLAGGEEGPSAVPSAEAYCPFGGFETLYRYISSGGKFLTHAHASNLVLFIAILLSAFFARGFFCGWVCPFGAIQEGIMTLRNALLRRAPFLRRAVRALELRAAPLAALDKPMRWLRYVMLGWIAVGTVVYGEMVFRTVDPWEAFITVAELELTGGMMVLIVVLVASFFVERPWCRYACPLGAIVGSVGKLSPLSVQRESAACLACGVCNTNCPMGIPVDHLTRVDNADCIMCLRCVGVCPTREGLNVTLTLPSRVPAEQQPRQAA
ncbi:MAG: 4Fe-4S binding protein [Chloroflexota bacterium]